jgi:hypothetical protein
MTNFQIEYIEAIEALNCDNRANLPLDYTIPESVNCDYDIELRKTWVCMWKSLIAYPVVWTYEFTSSDIKLLRELTKIGIQTGCLSKLYDDEIEQVLIRFKREWHEGQWFVRLDSLSPKDGVEYPVREARRLLEQLCTSKRFQSALAADNRCLYFLDFDFRWNKQCEYRVFVNNGRLTAISQYSTEELISEEFKIRNWKQVIDWLENDVINRALNVLETRNFTIDIYINEKENKKEIIEFNSFGYWLAANGCLFNWTKDRDILYGKKDPNLVFIRLIQ